MKRTKHTAAKRGEYMERNRLSLKLLELRQKHNLTQKQLCADLNLSRSNYSYFEWGKRTPDINTLLLIAQYYKISLDELVIGSHPASRHSEGTSASEQGLTVLRHLRAKHIPVENIMELSKTDFDFLSAYKKLSADNKAELSYLMNYKLKRQSG